MYARETVNRASLSGTRMPQQHLTAGKKKNYQAKLEVLSYFGKIPICAAYEIDGVRTDRFPVGDSLVNTKPVCEYLEGFKTDITKCRKGKEFPCAALECIRFIASAVGCPIKYVSVGAEWDDYLVMR